MTRNRRQFVLLAVGISLVLIAGTYWYVAVRTVPVRYTDPDDRFNYGSLGTEFDAMPLYVWEALPEVCSDRLPGGYASLGFIYEPGKARPVGISQRTVGVPRMGLNCATCHVGTVRASPGADRW